MTTREVRGSIAGWEWSVDGDSDGVLLLRLSGSWRAQSGHHPGAQATDGGQP